MKVKIHAPLWTKPLYALGIISMMTGVCSHFFGWPPIADEYMAALLIGGVLLIIPYQFYALCEMLKYRPKGD